MIRDWRHTITAAAVCSLVVGHVWAQPPQFATMDIEFENGVVYFGDLADPSRSATSPNVVSASVRNFMPFIAIDDIVSVNGKPARGSAVASGWLTLLAINPTPGQAIGDIGRGSLVDFHLEILQSDGTRVGSIMSSGFGVGGPAPPGVPSGVFSNQTVVGGTGAFLGARGMVTNPAITHRTASMEEDPANRRTHGGGRGRWIVHLIPLFRPEIVTTASGPAVFHADFSPVTTSRPARAGEILILTATGLGPTRPGVNPGTPFRDNPVQEVNSPVEVTVSGTAADVVNKIGWPGTTNTYRVDIRVPDGIAPGMAALQVTAAFIPGPEVSIAIQ